jgi:hypothetical protein
MDEDALAMDYGAATLEGLMISRDIGNEDDRRTLRPVRGRTLAAPRGDPPGTPGLGAHT